MQLCLSLDLLRLSRTRETPAPGSRDSGTRPSFLADAISQSAWSRRCKTLGTSATGSLTGSFTFACTLPRLIYARIIDCQRESTKRVAGGVRPDATPE